MKLEIVTNESGDWGIAYANNLQIDSGHHVVWSPLIEAICLSAGIALTTREISDDEMENL